MLTLNKIYKYVRKMEQKDIIYVASRAFGKDWDYETIRWGDDMYGKSEYVQEVFEYFDEIKEIGRKAFYEKYKEFNLY